MPKIEIKNIGYVWHAYMPDGKVLKSAGISEIADMVLAAAPKLEAGRTYQWSVSGSKFVLRDVESTKSKLSKTEQS